MNRSVEVGWAEKPFVLELRKEITNIEKRHPGPGLTVFEEGGALWSRLVAQTRVKTRRQASSPAPAMTPSGLLLRPELGLELHLDAALGDGPFTARRGRIWILPVLRLQPGIPGHDRLLELDEYGFEQELGVTAVGTEEMRLAGEVGFIPDGGGEGLTRLAMGLDPEAENPWRWALLEWFGPRSGGFWSYDQIAELQDLRGVDALSNGAVALAHVLGTAAAHRIEKRVELSRGMDRV